jgi:predicted Zn-dependent protease
MSRGPGTTLLLLLSLLPACSAGAGLQVLSAADDAIRVERLARPLVATLPWNYLGRRFTFYIVGDDRAAGWNVAPGTVYVSQHAARYASDEELVQLLAHTLGHDLLSHPAARTDVSDSRLAAEVATVIVVPGGLLFGGLMEGVTGARDYTLGQEIEAERIGLRLWLRSGRSCAAWLALRQEMKAAGRSWHEPIKDIAPPFDDLIAAASRDCAGRP